MIRLYPEISLLQFRFKIKLDIDLFSFDRRFCAWKLFLKVLCNFYLILYSVSSLPDSSLRIDPTGFFTVF